MDELFPVPNSIKRNLSVEFSFNNKTNISSFTEEQKSIFIFLNNYLRNDVFNVVFYSINFYFNYYHSNKENGGEEFEIDAIAFFKIKSKTYIMPLEYKNYSRTFEDVPKQEIDFKKCIEKISKFKKHFFPNDKNIIILFTFLWKDKNSEFHKKLIDVNKAEYPFYTNKRNDTNEKKIQYVLSSKFLSQLTLSFLEEKLKKPRDVGYFIDCFNAKIKPFSNNKNEDSNIFNVIDSNELSIIEGMAGSGKTSIAFYLFGYFNNSVLWLINDKFCKEITKHFDIDLNLKEHSSRILWNSNDVEMKIKEKFNSDSVFYLIIDEAQRFNSKNLDLVDKILKDNKNIKVILLGDKNQMINPVNDKGYSIFEKSIYSNKFELKKCYRIPKKTINIIKYIFCLTDNKPNYKDKKMTKYGIEIFDNINSLQQSFIENSNSKLCVYSTLQYTDYCFENPFKKIGLNYAFNNMRDRYIFTHIEHYVKSYCFFPYDLISREIYASYIYLPKEVHLSENGKIIHETRFLGELNIFLYNQLYVLLSRATNKIAIFIANDAYRIKCRKRLQEFERDNIC